MEVKLILDDLETVFGIEFLKNIVSNIPDSKKYVELFHKLAQHKSTEIREGIAYKDAISEETCKLLLQDRESDVLESIVRNERAKEVISEEDINHILEVGSKRVISNLIYNVTDFETVDSYEVLKKIIELEDDGLTLEIADGYGMPKRILKELQEHSDPDISEKAKASLES